MPAPDLKPEFRFFDGSEAQPNVGIEEGLLPIDLRWLRVEEFLRSRELSKNTDRAYRRDLHQFAVWTDKPWHCITHRDIDRYKEHLQNRTSPTGDKLSSATINRALAALQSFFKWLTVKGYIAKNPALTLEKPKPDPVESKELREVEVKALYAALAQRGEQEARDTALLRVLEHGLRASEVSALNIEDYDGKRLHIREAKAGSVGFVPLVQEACKALDAYLGQRLRQGLPTTPDSPLFLSVSNNSVGKRLSYWGIYKIIQELAELAEIPGCHPHRLRHTFATNLVLKGMDIALARQLTRHRSESSFARYNQRALEIEAEKQFIELFEKSE